MKPEDVVRLRHMIEAAEAGLRFVEGRERIDLDNDLMLSFALVRAVEIVGEAAARISAESRASAAEIPWQAIIGMRNRLVHAYFDIDHDILWVTVKEELPALVAQLRQVEG